MDLSNSISKIFRSLFRAEVIDLRVYTHPPDINSLGHWITTVHFQYDQKNLQAGATDKDKHKALVKSLIEAGEAIIAYNQGRMARCGLAGGIFRSTTVDRAKSEILERDAFLFHYRNNIPFDVIDSQMPSNSAIHAFGMNVRDPEKSAVFVTDKFGASGEDRCLYFGTSCGSPKSGLIEKAYTEYSAISFNHRHGDSECRSGFKKIEAVNPAILRHHISSLDLRNRQRIQGLCVAVKKVQKARPPIDPKGWKIEFPTSPIRGISYVQARHPDLLELEFGKSEEWIQDGAPLYHPFF